MISVCSPGRGSRGPITFNTYGLCNASAKNAAMCMVRTAQTSTIGAAQSAMAAQRESEVFA